MNVIISIEEEEHIIELRYALKICRDKPETITINGEEYEINERHFKKLCRQIHEQVYV